MTLGEVKSEILTLGFMSHEDFSDNPEILINAVNRSIATIASEVRPILGRLSLRHTPLENISTNKSHELLFKGEPIVIKAKNAKSYCFFCNGNLKLSIKDDNGNLNIPLKSDGDFICYRGFLTGNTTFTFKGDFSATIKDFAVYDKLLSLEKQDIPQWNKKVTFDIKNLAKEKGLEFCGFPSEFVFNLKGDYKVIDNSILEINGSESQSFWVNFKKIPPRISQVEENSAIIPIDDDVSTLVPLLAAYYALSDDEPQKAQQCYQDYQNRRLFYIKPFLGKIAKVEGGHDNWL